MKRIDVKLARGFSLIEIMLCVTILAIITNYALSYYKQSLIRSHRIEATIALSELADKLELYYNQEHEYKGASITKLHINPITQHGYYKLTIASVDKTSYLIKAQPLGNQKQDTLCEIFVLNSEGKQMATGQSTDPERDCW
jgi:type IV pilus assembly protein PilE